MPETVEELREEHANGNEHEEDPPLPEATAETEAEDELGCTVEGGVVRL